MPIRKIQYLRIDGKECCRCGVPFYRMVNIDLTDVPETPPTSPLVLRRKSDPLRWEWVNRRDVAALGRMNRPGWFLQRVDPTPDGVFCFSCSKREDKWIGIEGRPHLTEVEK